MLKIKARLGIGFCGAEHKKEFKFDDDEFEGMTEDEKNSYIDECVQDWANDYIEITWQEVEKED